MDFGKEDTFGVIPELSQPDVASLVDDAADTPRLVTMVGDNPAVFTNKPRQGVLAETHVALSDLHLLKLCAGHPIVVVEIRVFLSAADAARGCRSSLLAAPACLARLPRLPPGTLLLVISGAEKEGAAAS